MSDFRGKGNKGEILAFRNLEVLGKTSLRLAVGFLAVCVLIFGAIYFFKFRTERQITEATTNFNASAEILRQEKFVSYRNYVREINALKETLTNKIYASSVFSALEGNTTAGVVWTGGTLGSSANLFSLAGAANSYSTVAKQAVAFRQAGFSKVEIKDLKLSKDGGVTFAASFIFNEALKKKSGN